MAPKTLQHSPLFQTMKHYPFSYKMIGLPSVLSIGTVLIHFISKTSKEIDNDDDWFSFSMLEIWLVYMAGMPINCPRLGASFCHCLGYFDCGDISNRVHVKHSNSNDSVASSCFLGEYIVFHLRLTRVLKGVLIPQNWNNQKSQSKWG